MMRLLVVAAFLVVSAACGSAEGGGSNDKGFGNGNDGGTGGIAGNGGTGGEDPSGGGTGGDGITCENFEACGGDPVGTWKVVETCFSENSRAPYVMVEGCKDLPYTFSGFVSGTYIFDSYEMTVDTQLMGVESWTLTEECLSALHTSCRAAASGLDYEVTSDGDCVVKAENRSHRYTIDYRVEETTLRLPGIFPELSPFCVREDQMGLFEFGINTLLLERR